MKGKYGLLGEHLTHSFSPEIHRRLGTGDYRLYPMAWEDAEKFIRTGDWSGLNVTVPYKKRIYGLLDEYSDSARATGSVNTVVRRKDGRLFGDNTDVDGFLSLVKRNGFSMDGKILILGSGGASCAATEALARLGKKALVISRTGENNYTNLERHRDASWIINTTPVGMFPSVGEKPVSLHFFPELRGVIDLIYNPFRTSLLLEAEEKGIPYANGLDMLVEQARRSEEIFRDTPIPEKVTGEVLRWLRYSVLNLVLIGMPGSGKSALASRLSALTGREVLDTDRLIEKKTGQSAEKWLREKGESAFRAEESLVLREAGKRTGVILSCGGGAVLRPENRSYLRENGWVVYVRRDLSSLSTRHRPLSEETSPEEMLSVREPLYRSFADASVENDRSVNECAAQILDLFRLAAEKEFL